MKALVVINEQHSLMPDQVRVLQETFESFVRVNVPAEGWTLVQMQENAEVLVEAVQTAYYENAAIAVVFASPIPALMKSIMCSLDVVDAEYAVFVLHNDRREKKELPGGKIIMTVAAEGWQLV